MKILATNSKIALAWVDRQSDRDVSQAILWKLLLWAWISLHTPLVLSQSLLTGDLALLQPYVNGRLGVEVIDALETKRAKQGRIVARVPVVVAYQVPEVKSLTLELHSPAGRAALAGTADRILESVPQGSFEHVRRWKSIPGMAGMVNANGLLALLAQPEVKRIDVDSGGSGGLAQSVPQVGLDRVQRDLGFTGRGVRVAVLDSGIDTDHPDLARSLIGQRCFAEGGLACPDGAFKAEDDFGHGTWVSGIVTADGIVSPMGGAPGAEIFAIKVLDSRNRFSQASFVIDGLDFVIAELWEIDIVNMSLGTFTRFTGECDDSSSFTMLFASAINTLRSRGVLTTVSTGNEGQANSMRAPACVSEAIAVGAVYDTSTRPGRSFGVCTDNDMKVDEPACYSNSSSATDIFAPGSEITTSSTGGGIRTVDGTSFAAPLVAACIAAIQEAVPTLQPSDIEKLIEENTDVMVQNGGRVFPRLDCYEAILAGISGPINKQPSISIDSPVEGSTVQAHLPIKFSGTAKDEEDGVLSQWINWSDNGVTFATGVAVSRSFLPGPHTITATVTDRDGLSASSTVLINAVDRENCLFNANFEGDTEGFVFIDDPEDPSFTSGSVNDGSLQLWIGGIDNSDIAGMEGVWQRSCYNDVPRTVIISVRAMLTQASDYESDESSGMRLTINGMSTVPVTLIGNGNGGSEQSTGWQTFTLQATLTAGVNTLDLECYNNKKTFANEVTSCFFESVMVDTLPLAADCLFNADFEDNAEGFVFVEDPENPKYTLGSVNSGGLQVLIGGIDNSDILGMDGAWARSCTNDMTRTVVMAVRAILTQASDYESDESSGVRLTINGTSMVPATLTGNGNGGSDQSTGLQTFTVRTILSPGVNRIGLECFNNKKTYANEVTTCLFDGVTVEIPPPTPLDRLLKE